jgi:hypothetical protein
MMTDDVLNLVYQSLGDAFIYAAAFTGAVLVVLMLVTTSLRVFRSVLRRPM